MKTFDLVVEHLHSPCCVCKSTSTLISLTEISPDKHQETILNVASLCSSLKMCLPCAYKFKSRQDTEEQSFTG